MVQRQSELAKTHAFILAGGQGVRLRPLTISQPKPAVSFGGIFRIIDFTLSNCLNSGLDRVSILTQYQHETLHRYIRQTWFKVWKDVSPNQTPPVCLAPVSGKHYRGTADAIFRNAEILTADCEYVLVLSGDHIYEMDYGVLLQEHVRTKADLTIATVEHPLGEASHFGVVEVDENFKVTGFEEKPAAPRPLPRDSSQALVSMGIYVFNKTLLVDCLRTFCDAGLGFDFGHHIVPALIHSARVYAYDFRNTTTNTPHYWRDIGTTDGYYAASMDLVESHSAAVQNRSLKLPAYTLGRTARLHSSCEVIRSVLAPNVLIGQGAKVHESILMQGVRIGERAQLRRTIVAEGVQIPADFRSGFDLAQDRKHYTVTDSGVVVIHETPVRMKPTISHFAVNTTGMRKAMRAKRARSIRASA